MVASHADLAAAAKAAGCELRPLASVPTHGAVLGHRAGQMLQVQARDHPRGHAADPAAEAAAWTLAALGPAITHPGLRGCVRRANGLGARLFVDTSLGQKPQAYSAHAAFLSAVGGYYNVEGSRVAMAPDCLFHELLHELTHLAFDKRVRVASQRPNAEQEPLRTHWQAYRSRGYSELCAEELVCREHEMHTLRAAPPLTWFTRTWVLWDSALVEASRDRQAVPAAERTQHQAAELQRIFRLRTFVTGPVARVAHLLLAGGAATWLTTASVASVVGAVRGLG
jgi:hypothetical protein